jgi:hypothetical protein
VSPAERLPMPRRHCTHINPAPYRMTLQPIARISHAFCSFFVFVAMNTPKDRFYGPFRDSQPANMAARPHAPDPGFARNLLSTITNLVGNRSISPRVGVCGSRVPAWHPNPASRVSVSCMWTTTTSTALVRTALARSAEPRRPRHRPGVRGTQLVGGRWQACPPALTSTRSYLAPGSPAFPALIPGAQAGDEARSVTAVTSRPIREPLISCRGNA